ncbi:helix-turn-helix domain-containing protein [Qipengyuania sp. RANM35]|uniref:helix-turn-helix domain-containing protein n=1 Tax=Qipengyuania sp. RANM35 TaxID=3068635 RepID=UPI0034DB0159
MSPLLQSIERFEAECPDLASSLIPVGVTRYWGVSLGWPEWIWKGTKLSVGQFPTDAIPLSTDLRLIANLVENVGEEYLLRSLLEWPFVPHEDILFASPDLASAMKAIGSRITRTNPCMSMSIGQARDGVEIVVEIDPCIGELRGFLELVSIIFLFRLVNSFTGFAGRELIARSPISAQLRNAEVGLVELVDGVEGGQFAAGADITRIVLSHEYLTLPNPEYRPDRWQVVVDELARDAAIAGPLGHEALRALIKKSLKQHRRTPQIAELASQRQTSVRSLARELAGQGLSLREVANEAKMELSTEYLRDDSMTVAQISSSLGYSEASSFIRSFRKKFGVAPGEWRRASAAS